MVNTTRNLFILNVSCLLTNLIDNSKLTTVIMANLAEPINLTWKFNLPYMIRYQSLCDFFSIIIILTNCLIYCSCRNLFSGLIRFLIFEEDTIGLKIQLTMWVCFFYFFSKLVLIFYVSFSMSITFFKHVFVLISWIDLFDEDY